MIECIVWEITLKCNANCIHCGSNAGNKRISELTTTRALDLCKQIAELGCKNVTLIGGEIFLRDDWELILENLISNGIKVSIVTNGLLLSSSNMKIIESIGVRNIGISFDAGTEQTFDYIRGFPGTFTKILHNIKRRHKSHLNLSIITTLNKFNITELKVMRELFIDLPVKVWQIQIASPNGRMQKEFILSPEQFYIAGLFFAKSRKTTPKETLAIVCNHDFGYYSKTIPQHTIYNKWTGCPAGIKTLGIRSNGIIQGCLSMDYNIFNDGDITNTTLKELLALNNTCSWNKKNNKLSSLEDFCLSCEHSTVCLGGCSDISYSLTNSVSNNPLCYYRIEKTILDQKPKNDFERVFTELTSCFIDNKGTIFLKSGEAINNNFINKLNLSINEKNLLQLLAEN